MSETSGKTIWYCHPYAGSPSLGMSYRPYYLSREFNRLGHQAFVISSSFHHLLQKKSLQKEKIKAQTIDAVPFITLKTRFYANNGIARFINMLGYAWRFRRQIKKIIKITGKPDVIIVSSAHPFHYPILEKKARALSAKIVFEVRDLWPLSLIELLSVSPRHPVIRWLDKIERQAYEKSDFTVSLLSNALPYMKERGLSSEKFKVISNGTDGELFQNPKSLSPVLKEKLLELQATGAFLLGYAGAMGEPNALEYLIRAMAILNGEQIPVHCVILGDGNLKAHLEALVIQLQLSNVSFFPGIHKEQVPAYLNMMDGLYLGWKDTELYKYGTSPNKLFDYMMAGKPIIESGGAPNSILEEFACGIRCKAGDINEIALAIKRLLNLSPEEIETLGSRGKEAITTHFNYPILAKEYLKLF